MSKNLVPLALILFLVACAAPVPTGTPAAPSPTLIPATSAATPTVVATSAPPATPGGSPAATPPTTPTRSSVTVTPSADLNIALLLAAGSRDERALALRRTFLAQAQTVRANVIVQFADGDTGRQQTQFEDALARSLSVIVIEPVDADAAAPFVAAAHRAGVKIIALDDLIRSAEVDLVVGADPVAAGQMQVTNTVSLLRKAGLRPPWNFVILEKRAGDPTAAQLVKGYYSALAPYIDKQQARIVADVAHRDGSAAQASATLTTTLKTISGTVQAVLANTSELARGAQAGLAAARVITPVVISFAGLDLDGIRAICSERVQFATVPPYPDVGEAAARAAIQLAQGQEVRTDQTIDIGDKPVPFIPLAPRGVTTETMQAAVVQPGIYSLDQAAACLPPLARGANIPKINMRTSLTIWTDEDENEVYPYLANLAAQFRLVNPTVAISLTTFPGDSLAARLDGLSDPRALPDLVWSSNRPLVRWNARGLFQPIDAQIDVTRFMTDAVSAVQPVTRTQTLGVPVTYGGHLMLFYNKALVTTPPVSTDDLFRLGPILGKPGGAQFELAFDQKDPRYLVPWLYGFGGRVITDTAALAPAPTRAVTPTQSSATVTPAFRPTPTQSAASATPVPTLTASAPVTIALNTRAMSDTVGFLAKLHAESVIPPEGGYDVADALFESGRAALVISGEWSINPYLDALGDNLGLARLPLVSSTGRVPLSFGSGKYIFIPRALDGDKLLAAKAWIEFITSRPIQLELAAKFHRLPALREAFTDPAIAADPQLGVSAQLLTRYTLVEPAGYSPCVEQAIQSQMTGILSGQTPAGDALREMQTRAERCLGVGP